jgi:hypothetical protein
VKGLEPSDLLHAMQALYQLSYTPRGNDRLPAAVRDSYRSHVEHMFVIMARGSDIQTPRRFARTRHYARQR